MSRWAAQGRTWVQSAVGMCSLSTVGSSRHNLGVHQHLLGLLGANCSALSVLIVVLAAQRVWYTPDIQDVGRCCYTAGCLHTLSTPSHPKKVGKYFRDILSCTLLQT